MKEIAIRLREVTDKTCSVLDWDTREDVKAQLRWDIVDVLAEYGFPLYLMLGCTSISSIRWSATRRTVPDSVHLS